MPNSGDLVPLLPPRKVLFRQRGQNAWEEHYFTILGHPELLEKDRSTRPMRLILSTTLHGYGSTEILGLDLFAALASAMLSVENMAIRLQRVGELRLREGGDFDVASDSVFFGDRIKQVQESLRV
jgi:hypothetical protein